MLFSQLILNVLLVILTLVFLKPFVSFNYSRAVLQLVFDLSENYHNVQTLHYLIRKGRLLASILLLLVAELINVPDKLLTVLNTLYGQFTAQDVCQEFRLKLGVQ